MILQEQMKIVDSRCEFCIENDELCCIKHDEFCIKSHKLCIKGGSPAEETRFPAKFIIINVKFSFLI